MKKMFVMLAAVALTVAAQAASASVDPIENQKVVAAFEKQFVDAINPTWIKKEGYYLVSFKYNNDRMLAWYTEEGKMEAVQRSVQPQQMTYLASKAVEELSKDKSLLNVAEISKEGELFYLVKVDDEKYYSVYKVYASGDHYRISRTKNKKS